MNLTVILLVAIGLTLGIMLSHNLSTYCKAGSNTQTFLRVVYLACAMGMLLAALSLLGAAAMGARA